MNIVVGVRDDGSVILSTMEAGGCVATISMSLVTAEWLRDRLFHVCARERAAISHPASGGTGLSSGGTGESK
jgi:hypothetical protein